MKAGVQAVKVDEKFKNEKTFFSKIRGSGPEKISLLTFGYASEQSRRKSEFARKRASKSGNKKASGKNIA